MPKLIASFQVDHTKIVPGIYVSRRDRVGDNWVTTFDIRMKRPNVEPALHPNAMHTIEHVVATYLRNSRFADKVVYWGPMGCLTGCYFITATAEEIMPRDIEKLIRDAFRHMANYRGEVPGATAVNCGNYRLHDLAIAKLEAKEFISREWKFEYPKARRIKCGGKTFFDA
ncbi:MAG: S-ribosylhomocysteine lyase [Kiritimatiellae bacterium]|jgi:S-ribosylhomocysteine lyase|nr:S-ribosylhomocysteine lyase [Kiritimatiellia bacterium]